MRRLLCALVVHASYVDYKLLLRCVCVLYANIISLVLACTVAHVVLGSDLHPPPPPAGSCCVVFVCVARVRVGVCTSRPLLFHVAFCSMHLTWVLNLNGSLFQEHQQTTQL